jgi:hypothetical protein
MTVATPANSILLPTVGLPFGFADPLWTTSVTSGSSDPAILLLVKPQDLLTEAVAAIQCREEVGVGTAAKLSIPRGKRG